jgi:hypothetical protein
VNVLIACLVQDTPPINKAGHTRSVHAALKMIVSTISKRDRLGSGIMPVKAAASCKSCAEECG